MLLQLSPVLTVLISLLFSRIGTLGTLVLSPVILACGVWGLGYAYLGRMRRFLMAWAFGWIVLPGAYLLLVFVMRGSLVAVALLFTSSLVALVALVYLAIDARRIATEVNAALAEDPKPSRRSSLELSCAAEAVGLTLDEVGEEFWQGLRPDWLNGSQSERPFDDEAINAVYGELAGMRTAAP
jgi:hypothetical protein